TYQGVFIGDMGTSGNVVAGNFIGTDATGTGPLANGGNGVYVFTGATNNVIGSAGGANVISGNAYNGVVITGAGTSGNTVAGNLIGTAAGGTQPLGNTGDGVFVLDGANGNTIGGTGVGAGNTIAGNGARGVEIQSGAGDAILGN